MINLALIYKEGGVFEIVDRLPINIHGIDSIDNNLRSLPNTTSPLGFEIIYHEPTNKLYGQLILSMTLPFFVVDLNRNLEYKMRDGMDVKIEDGRILTNRYQFEVESKILKLLLDLGLNITDKRDELGKPREYLLGGEAKGTVILESEYGYKSDYSEDPDKLHTSYPRFIIDINGLLAEEGYKFALIMLKSLQEMALISNEIVVEGTELNLPQFVTEQLGSKFGFNSEEVHNEVIRLNLDLGISPSDLTNEFKN